MICTQTVPPINNISNKLYAFDTLGTSHLLVLYYHHDALSESHFKHFNRNAKTVLISSLHMIINTFFNMVIGFIFCFGRYHNTRHSEYVVGIGQWSSTDGSRPNFGSHKL